MMFCLSVSEGLSLGVPTLISSYEYVCPGSRAIFLDFGTIQML